MIPSALRTIIVACAVLVSTSCMAAQPSEVSIKYVNAAIGSIANNTKVVVRGFYGANLESAITWDGYSDFRIKDSEGNTFSFMVCKTNGDVFKRLFNTPAGTHLWFSCQKYKMGGDGNDCLVVLDVRVVDAQRPSAPGASPKELYRVTLTNADGAQTVIPSVALNAPCQAGSLRITIEKEKSR